MSTSGRGPRDHEPWYSDWLNRITRRHGGAVVRRPINHSERDCHNCVRNNDCWRDSSRPQATEENIDELQAGLPSRFHLRATWDDERFVNYMQAVLAGLCRSFENRHPEVRRRQHAKDLKEGKADWDL